MTVHDLGKSLLLGLVIVGIFALLIAGRATLDDVDQVLTLIVGYLIGNGVNALRRQPPSPAIGPRRHHDHHDHDDVDQGDAGREAA